MNRINNGGPPQPQASPVRDLVFIVATIGAGLAMDQYGGLAGQLGVAVLAWGVFFRLVRMAPPDWRLPLYLCLVWSTIGEIFLSLVWGLYSYRLGNVPFFIPPGHVMLFYLGLVLAPRAPRAFVLAVPVAAAAYAAWATITGADTLSVPLAALFILCWMQASGRNLYSVMLVAALALELYGTWMGNWGWHAEVQYLPMTSANPPLVAGAFYCALDVLVGMTARLLRRRGAVRTREAQALS